jgi:hypothetical protein
LAFVADRYSGNCDFPAGPARQRLSLSAKQGDDRGANGADTGNPDAQGRRHGGKAAKPGGGRRQRVAAEGIFARFSRCDQGRVEPQRGQSGEACGKEAKLNLAKSSDSIHEGFCGKKVAEFGAKAEPIVGRQKSCGCRRRARPTR